MDRDGYPTEETIKYIKDWSGRTYEDYNAFAQYICDIWHYPEWATFKGRTLRLATGGWSGNEDIISALRHNFLFSCNWQMSARGGLHVYKLPIKSFFKRVPVKP